MSTAKTKVILLLVLIAGTLSGVAVLAQTSTAQPPSAAVKLVWPAITADELKSAGFTGVVAQKPLAERYHPPVYYFHVKETATGADGQAWGDVANLVAVLVRPMSDKNWVYNNGNMEIRDLTSRNQARVSSPGYYIVVTGPDKTKVMTLAHNLKVLY